MSSCEHLQALADFILPEEITDNFDIAGIEEKSGVLHVRFNEQVILRAGYTLDRVSPNGFFPSASVCDFPIRDRRAVFTSAVVDECKGRQGKAFPGHGKLRLKGRVTRWVSPFLKEVFGYAPDSGQHP
jgi:hypothetical protein